MPGILCILIMIIYFPLPLVIWIQNQNAYYTRGKIFITIGNDGPGDRWGGWELCKYISTYRKVKSPDLKFGFSLWVRVHYYYYSMGGYVEGISIKKVYWFWPLPNYCSLSFNRSKLIKHCYVQLFKCRWAIIKGNSGTSAISSQP